MLKLLGALPLLAVLLFQGATLGHADILFSGTEDVEFVCTGSCSVQTSGSPFRSSFSRQAYSTPQAGAADPPADRFSSSIFTASAAIWVHWQYCHSNGGCGANTSSNANTANAQMLRVIDSSANATLIVRGTGTAGQLKISSRTSGGVFTDLVTCPSAFDTALTQLDLHVVYGTSGSVTLYKNSVQVCNFTGDVTNGDGATTLNKVTFANITATFGFFAPTSEVIVATTDTRSKAVLSRPPVADGNAVQWTGTNICSAIWNVSAFNDASYAQSPTNNQLQQCTISTSLPAGTWRVDAVTMSARIQRGATGPQNFEWLTRTGGSDFTSADVQPTFSFSNFQNVQNLNPATSLSWTTSDVTAAGFNLGLKSTP